MKTKLFFTLGLIFGFMYIPALYAQTGNFPGTALEFDETDDYVNVGNDASLYVGNTLTIEAWIKPAGLSARQDVFSTRKDNSSGSFQLEVGPGQDGTNRVAVTSPGTWVAQTGDNAISPNEWNHIVYTRSRTGSGTHKIYVNGEQQTLVTDADYTFTNNTSDKVIAAGVSGGQLFIGEIDEVRIWNTALDSTQIRENMNLPLTDNEAGLVNYWQFNDGSGTTLSDAVGSNNGKLNNKTNNDWVTSSIQAGA